MLNIQTIIIILITAIIMSAITEVFHKFFRKHDIDNYISSIEFERRCGERRHLCGWQPALQDLKSDVAEVKKDVRELRQILLKGAGTD